MAQKYASPRGTPTIKADYRGPARNYFGVLAGVFFKEGDGVLHRQNALGGIVGNFNTELLFKCHDQLDRVETVSTEIVDEAGAVDYFVGVDAKMFHNDIPNTI